MAKVKTIHVKRGEMLGVGKGILVFHTFNRAKPRRLSPEEALAKEASLSFYRFLKQYESSNLSVEVAQQINL